MRRFVSIPEVYIKLCKLMEDPNSKIGDFSVAVSQNPEVVSAILSFVNSPFFGIPTQIDSISRAIDLLGIGQLFEIVADIAEMGLPQMLSEQVLMPFVTQSHSMKAGRA